MASGLLFLLLLGIGGNIYSEAFRICYRGSCSNCLIGWTEYYGNCYKFENIDLDWASAELLCINYGGHLTSIQGTDQYNFIRDLIFKGAGFNKQSWVGGISDWDGVWRWTDGTQFTFDSWGSGQPNNQGGNQYCMDINVDGQDYVGNDVCSQRNSFVCAKAY